MPFADDVAEGGLWGSRVTTRAGEKFASWPSIAEGGAEGMIWRRPIGNGEANGRWVLACKPRVLTLVKGSPNLENYECENPVCLFGGLKY